MRISDWSSDVFSSDLKFRVAARVFLFQIVKQAAALVDEHQKATTAVVILVMTFEMLGQVRDALGQDRHLHLGRTRIAILAGMFLDEFLLALSGNRHRHPFKTRG